MPAPLLNRHARAAYVGLIYDSGVDAKSAAEGHAPKVVVGIAGAHRNASAAVSADGGLLGCCEQDRLKRVRGLGLELGRLPKEAVHAVLACANRLDEPADAFVIAEPQVSLPIELTQVRLASSEA